jgi:hypothetical protein
MGSEAFDDFTLLRFPWHNHSGHLIQAQIALARIFVRSMALETIRREDRPDIEVKADRFSCE